jgi:hypothetical protein
MTTILALDPSGHAHNNAYIDPLSMPLIMAKKIPLPMPVILII